MKKVLSLALALVLCLGLIPAASAADTLTGNQLYPAGDWGNGPSLTLTGVVGEAETPIDPSYLYDVEVGGSLVLEMTYPAGKDRSYSIMIGGFYITPDFDPPDDNDKAAWDALGATWDLTGSVRGGDFDESSGAARFVYTFTEADMGQKNGLDKIIYPDIFWCDDANGDGQADGDGSYGSVYFGIRVVPAASGTKNIAYASTQTVDVDGKAVEFEMYALKNEAGNMTNYVKLRDLATILNGTQAQFAVGWDGAVNIETGKEYTPDGTEMKTPYSGDRAYQEPTAPTNINGAAAEKLTAIVLTDDAGSGYTYYQLRDLGEDLGFNVGWSAEKGVFVETDKPYSSAD